LNPDVVAAITRLRADNVLAGPQATLLNRVARRHLVSVRLEIRILLYAGVLLLTSGVGVLVVEHQQEIGPLAIAGALGLAAAACLVWVARQAPPFSWRAVESPNVAFDYILLLGLLLIVAFSAGLAATLVGLGLVVVMASGVTQRIGPAGRAATIVSAVSAAAIVAVGVVVTTQALPQL